MPASGNDHRVRIITGFLGLKSINQSGKENGNCR